MITVRVVERHGDYRHECGRIVNGRYWLPLGCHHALPRSAIEHAARLSAVGSDANTGGLPRPVDVEPTAEVRARTSRRRGLRRP